MIATNLHQILDTIAQSARRAGRDPKEIKLVAVSKLVGAEEIRQAIESGQMVFGENYLQEAAEKIPLFPPTVRWHFIGHLQSNKARQAAELFDMIETVDRFKIARLLDERAKELGKRLSILVQVNIGREQQKSGVLPEETEILLRRIIQETSLVVRGLMTMPPYFSDPEKSRPYFSALKQLATELAEHHLFADPRRPDLSMGMSTDYPVAIEEGATIIRVGTALFGTRK